MKFFSLRYISFVLLLAPLTALATQTYSSVPSGGLVPCGVVAFSNYMGATECSFCDLAQLIQNIVNFLIMVSIPISVGMFAWAGILFFTNAANPKGIEHAKKIFSSVFIGFLIALSGWLVVQVILQAVTNTSFYTPTSWSSLSCPDANRPRNLSITNVLQGSTVVAAPAGPTTPTNPTGPGTVATDVASAIPIMCQIESGCGQNVDNGNHSGCNDSGACGPMQIKPATACATNSSFSSGCANGAVTNQAQVITDLQNVTSSQLLAGQILTTAQNSPQCGGSLDCAIAVYSGDPTALAPSACCSQGLAYQCPYDCGNTAPHSAQCDVSPTASCKPAGTCTAASGTCTAYGYLQLVKNGGR